MVKEVCHGVSVFNQPAGHVEAGETLIEAVKRETSEETGWRFEPIHISGIYQFIAPNGETYLRFTFFGELIGEEHRNSLDPAIEEVVWMDRLSLQRNKHKLRSQAVLKCIEDHEAGHKIPLGIVQQLKTVT